MASLSARRAWIEIYVGSIIRAVTVLSLSARRAWIEMVDSPVAKEKAKVALRKESVDRNSST